VLPGPDAARLRAQLIVWWALWAGMLVSLGVLWGVFGFLKLSGNQPQANPLVDLIGLVPLFVSIVIRWLVLPRYNDLKAALPMFVVGLTLAEGGGLLGLLMGGPFRDDLSLLGVLGILQFIPVFARRLAEPRPQGFIPNR
jgi:hypothetical protein